MAVVGFATTPSFSYDESFARSDVACCDQRGFVLQEPRSLYDEVKIFPLAKLDRKVTDSMLQKIIDEEEGRCVLLWCKILAVLRLVLPAVAVRCVFLCELSSISIYAMSSC